MPKKILVVEDEADIAKVLVKRLSKEGFEVLLAGDAYQGVALAHKEKPDLLILDLMMPAGDGLSVLQNLRKSTKTSTIPIIILTGNKDEEYKQKVLKEEVAAYLEKPYEADALIDTIKNILVI